MRAATAWAPVNIALVKHWGHRRERPGWPARSSLSLTLEHGATTTVEWRPARRDHHLCLDGWVLTRASGAKAAAAHALLDEVRRRAGLEGAAAIVDSRSSVPVGGGMASSAAGAAALTVAALEAAAIGHLVAEPDAVALCALAESISGVRSLRGGVVLLRADGDALRLDEVRTPLALALVSCLVEPRPKLVSSADGHAVARTSPFWDVFERSADERIDEMVAALAAGDLGRLGPLVEAEALAMHAVMLTSHPSIVYATDETWAVWRRVAAWRAEGLAAWCTLDAGPNPHVLCAERDLPEVARRLASLPEVDRTWTSRVHPVGAHVVPGPGSAVECP